MRLLIVLAFAAIIVSMIVALNFMSRRGGGSNRTVNALTVRIGLSVALFILLMVAWAAGWIQPHGLAG